MSDTLVLFVTDGGFLAPSLLVAEQVLAQGVGTHADVTIFTIDVDEDTTQQLEREVNHPAFSIVPMLSRDFEPPPDVEFYANHVPMASLARLSIEQEISPRYRHLVYLDGDLQIQGDINALVRHRVREGMIAAGRGSSWLDPHGTHGLDPEGYLDALGVAKSDYFNAGVMAVNRDTWADYAPRALDLFFENARKFPRHDQSALNAAFRGQVEHFHPAYNFHTFYASSYAHTIFRPKIIHFTGRAKPWHTYAPPWGARFAHRYRHLLGRHPLLQDYLNVSIPASGPRVLIQRSRMQLREGRRVLQRDRRVVHERRRLIRGYLRETEFPFK